MSGGVAPGSGWFDELGLAKNVLQKANYAENIRRTLEEIRGLEQGVSRGGAAGGRR